MSRFAGKTVDEDCVELIEQQETKKGNKNSFYLEAGTETKAFTIAAFRGAPFTNDDQQGTSFGRL